MEKPLQIFCCYARKDQRFLFELKSWLIPLQRDGSLSISADIDIGPGEDWKRKISDFLSTAHIILLLISPDFIASEYCYSEEMRIALERHSKGDVHIIPIILRPIYLQFLPFKNIQFLPTNARPITKWANRDDAFLDVTQGIQRSITEFMVLPKDGTRHRWIDITINPFSAVEQDRQRMIAKVRIFWIKDVFAPSLYATTGIALGLVEQPDMLGASQQRTSGTRSLPEGQRITQVFDDASRELLILGEAGSGKTTLLLELTRDLLDRSEENETHPIPVVFNLSSWTARSQTITHWLVEELNKIYHVPRKLGRAWVNDNRISPLFDGLDEVAPGDRENCINCLNNYFRENGPYQVAVCCRMTEYLAQARRLELHRAVVVQPLTEKQADDYLVRIGESQQPLREALKQDTSLCELARMPLMLSMLIQTYRDMPIDEIIQTASSAKQRQQVFDKYIERMLQRPDRRARYSSSQIKRGLIWLAQQMVLHNPAAFYLEDMQPDWYLQGMLLHLYHALVRLSIGVTCGAIFLFPGGVAVGLWFGEGFSLPFGITFGLLFGLIFALVSPVKTAITPAEVVRWSWTTMWQQFVKAALRNALVRILPSGLTCAFLGASLLYLFSKGQIVFASTGPQANILIYGAVCGLLGILLSGLCNAVTDALSRSMSNTDIPSPTSSQSIWHTLPQSLPITWPFALLAALLFGLIFGRMIGPLSGLFIGLLFGLVGLLLFGLANRVKGSLRLMDVMRWGWSYMRGRGVRAELGSMFGMGVGIGLMPFITRLAGPVSSLYIGLLAVVALWLLMGLNRGLSRGVLNRETMDKGTVVKPNQGIWNSARNSLLVGLIFGLLGGLLFGLIFALALALQGSSFDVLSLLPFMLIGGVLSGLGVGLLHGGIASLQHMVLRFLLCVWRKTPWNYVRFLDHAADSILLRKVGGGYIFVHRLLMEHFAKLNEEQTIEF